MLTAWMGGSGRAALRSDGGVDATKQGELSPAIVAGLVRSHLGDVKGCFDQALRGNPQLAGKVVAHFTIESSGSLSSIRFESDTVGDGEMAACIQARIAAWRFPPPSGGAVEVSFPFVFQSSEDPALAIPTPRSAPAAGKSKKAGDPELPVRSRLALGGDGELISTLTGVDQVNDGQTPHLEITRRRGHAGGVLTFDFSPAKYPALAEVIRPSFLWTVDSSFVHLGSKRIARVRLVGRTGQDLMVLQEIAILVDVDGDKPKLLWLGLGDREENRFDVCVVDTRATFRLAAPGVLERTRRSTRWASRTVEDESIGDYRRTCRAAPKATETFPLAGD